VSVAGVNADACRGKTLAATVADVHDNAISSGSAAIVLSGSSATVAVNFPVPVPVADVANTRLAIR
jgi:hypothetical protein